MRVCREKPEAELFQPIGCPSEEPTAHKFAAGSLVGLVVASILLRVVALTALGSAPGLWPRGEPVGTQLDFCRSSPRRVDTVQSFLDTGSSKMNIFVVVLVFLVVDGAEALQESQVCYILDGILFLYGIVLTFLYCRLKFQYRKKSKSPESAIYEKVDPIYTGLEAQEMQPYSTLETSKAPPEALPPRAIPSEE